MRLFFINMSGYIIIYKSKLSHDYVGYLNMSAERRKILHTGFEIKQAVTGAHVM